MIGGMTVSSLAIGVAIVLLGFLITSSMTSLLVLEEVYSQNNNKNNLTQAEDRANKSENRQVFRSPQSRSILFANQIILETDKQSYLTGQPVNISIVNFGIRPVHFSGGNSDIKITNLITGESYIPTTVLLESVIPSGSSKSIVWNQMNLTEQQVNPGKYLASVSVGSLKANTTFSITKN